MMVSPMRPLFGIFPHLIVTVLLGAAAGLAGQTSDAARRWSEQAYGFSMELPADLEAPAPASGAVLFRAADGAGRYTLMLEVDRPEAPMTLDQGAAVARELVRRGSPGSVFLEDPALSRRIEIEGREAYVLYHHVPALVEGRPETRLYGQLLLRIDPQTFLHLKMLCLRRDEARVRPIFEKLIRTVRVTDARTLSEGRRLQIESGLVVLKKLDFESLSRKLIENRFYRLLDATGRDAGYLKVREGLTTQDTRPGAGIEVSYRVLSGSVVQDTFSQFFLSEDRSYEKWSTRLTHRPLGAAQNQEKLSLAVTGIRVQSKLTLVTDGPDGPRQKVFVIPETGYLNQVEALVLERALPADFPATYGFYAWNSDQGALSYRTDRLVPTLSGFSLETRRSPNDSPVRSLCDDAGRMIEQHLPGGLKLVTTTAAELQRLWRGR